MFALFPKAHNYETPTVAVNLNLFFPLLILPILAWAGPEWTVEPLGDRQLSIELTGAVESTRPHHHRPTTGYATVSWMNTEGSQVAAGDPIIEFDTIAVEEWAREKADEREVEVAQLTSTRGSTDRTVTALELKRQLLDSESRYLRKRIAATRVKDKARKRVLELLLEQAQRNLAAARRHCQAVSASGAAELFSERYRAEAKDRLQRAEQAMKLPEFEVDLYERATGGYARKLFGIDLEIVSIELGNELGEAGVFGELAGLEKLQTLRDSVQTGRIRDLDWHLANYRDTINDSVLRASVPGVLSFNQDLIYKIEIGSKNPNQSLAFVLQQPDLVVRLALPEDIRHLVHPTENVTLTLPALSTSFSGDLVAVGATAHKRSGGSDGRVFDCVVHPNEVPTGLRAGMTAVAIVPIALPSASLVLPKWFVADPQLPEVVLHSGTRQRIEGFAVGPYFVATAGMNEGDIVVLPASDASNNLVRVSGNIEPVDPLVLKWEVNEIHGRRSRWMYEQLLADGTAVQRGTQLAELMRLEGVEDRSTFQLAHELHENRTNLAVAKIEAENALIKSYVAWRQASLSADRSRLEYLLERYSSFERELLQAEQKQQAAILTHEQAQREANSISADRTGFVSQHQRQEVDLVAQLAAITLRREHLNSISALRARDWLIVREHENKTLDDRRQAQAARQDYSRARITYQLAVTAAVDGFRAYMRGYHERRRDETRRILYAPQDGRLFFSDRGAGVPKIGQQAQRAEAFLMPTTLEWEVELVVPPRFYDRFAIGSAVSLVVPALDHEPRRGIVTLVSPYFEVTAQAFEDALLRDVVGSLEPIFYVRVRFSLRQDEIHKVSPGLTAFLDI